jgi:8-oxo-dGTP pyrophosphatase MutT (NUDIX family)
VLFQRRSAAKDTWPGAIDVAVTGHYRAGESLAEALREAEEEIGLPAAAVRVLGALEPHETVTRFLVTPFVGLVTAPFAPRPDPAEVEEVFEAPLCFVLDPANLQVHRRRWNGHWRRYYAIPYGPHYIWGATARMLKSLADRVGPGHERRMSGG